MKKFLLLFITAAAIPFLGSAQCTTNNSTDCECLDSSEMDCDLLPDVTVSWSTGYYGHTEYPPGEGLQSGELNYAENWFNITPDIEAMGRIRVSGKTPNIGVGPLNIRGLDKDGYRWMICDDGGVPDTFSIYDPNWDENTYCPDGSNPKHITFQNIYHKNADGSMDFWEKMIGTMEYHPTHGHMHFDKWVAMSLRVPDENNMENPLDWEVVGEGAKIGFCVMDLGSCGGGGCMDDETVYNQGVELFQSDFPNYGLGGGSYGCSPLSQGISSGYTDTYGAGLDGMFINIPLGTCNGDYAVVLVVENELLVESNTENNHAWFPITLTQQQLTAASMQITSSNSVLCPGDAITLNIPSASVNASFEWSTGATTPSIDITEPGTFSATMTVCGVDVEGQITVGGSNITAPVADNASVAEGGSVTLEATSDYDVNWYDENGNLVGSGNTFTTPVLYDDVTYFMSASEMSSSPSSVGPFEHEGENEYSNSGTSGYVEFDAMGSFMLNSVDVYTNQAGERTVVLLDGSGAVVYEHTEFIPESDQAPHTINLNFSVSAGNNYRLATGDSLNTVNFGDANPQLKRTDGDDAVLNYPYLVEDVVSLNDSPYGTDWYYYFYNWNISPTVECHMVPVEVIISFVSVVENKFELDVYPNPTNGVVNIDMALDKTSVVDLKFVNLLGEVVYSQNETTKSLSKQIDLRAFSKGIYTLSILVDGEKYIQKIVLQ